MANVASFEYIDTMIAAALKRPPEKSIAASLLEQANSAATISICGFSVYDEQKKKDALIGAVENQTRDRETFHRDRADIVKKLADFGVMPLAVVPVIAWNNICARANLYRLCPDYNGRVTVNFYDHRVANKIETHQLIWGWISGLSSVVALGATAIIGVNHLMPTIWQPTLAQFWTQAGVSAVGFGGALLIPYWVIVKRHCRLAMLLPNREDATHGTSIGLDLPQPPPEVGDILLKVRGLTLKVALEANAIRFSTSPSKLITQQLKVERARRRAHARAMRDPILYTKHGKAAAIIAQFGDFAIEKEAVDQVIGESCLF